MKLIKTSKWFLPAALCAVALWAFITNSCGEASSNMDTDFEPSPKGDSGSKTGGSDNPELAGITVSFDPQGGYWTWTEEEEAQFLASAVNSDATVKLPSAYLQRPGMLFVGWYTSPYTPPPAEGETPVDTQEEPVENSEEGQDDPGAVVEASSKDAPFISADTPVSEDGLFTEVSKLSSAAKLYARWQEWRPDAFLVTFIPYFSEGARGFTRQTVADGSGKQVIAEFPKISVSPEHYELADGNDRSWWTSPTTGEGEKWDSSMEVTDNSRILYGNWKGKTYTVTFDPNGGNISGDNTASVVYSSNSPNTVSFNAESLTYENYGF
jgi:hypothetical protein